MDTHTRYDKHQSFNREDWQLRDLGAGDTHSVVGSRGTVVHCLSGRLWVTQEGDPRDYVVPAGAHFCASGHGRIVAGAVADNTRIAVYRLAAQSLPQGPRNAVRFDAAFLEALQENARQERSRMIAAMLREAWRRLKRGWRRFLQSDSHAPTLRMREGG